jgi:diguanylate cyclase (GGDEF)-like protein/PAS domain S-box-containing protein
MPNTNQSKIPRILVVDDELVGRIYIEKALTGEGYEVLTAENGQQAVNMTRKFNPDLVVMDVMMPVMDGYQACSAIRQQENQLHVPILMLTGLDDIESVEKSFDAGATDFVVKPVNLPIFKQRIRYGLKTRETDLKLYHQQLRQIHAHKVAKLGYWDWDIVSHEIYWSDEVYELLAIGKEEFPTKQQALQARVFPEDLKKFKYTLKQTMKYGTSYSLEYSVNRPDGKFQRVYEHAELIKDDQGKAIRLMGIIQDITDRYLAQQKIQYQAFYDELTGLPNRTLFADRLDHALQMLERNDEEVAVFIIDLDRFKNINDSLGHDIGDGFLQAAASKLKKIIRSNDTLARLGGDEFALIIESVKSLDCIVKVVEKLLDVLSQPLIIENNELISTGSVGIAISSKQSRDKDTLLKQADLAMYEAKRQGGNSYRFYNSEMKSYATQLLKLENDLRKALERKELVLFYQPKCSVETGEVLGMEALVRWRHPEKGLVSPLDFISIAEETGLIIPMGSWAIEEACRQTLIWHQQGFDKLVVSINISARQFHHKGFEEEVLQIIKRVGIKPENVDLEVTESCTMNNIDKAVRILNVFRNQGIRISMDDFGTGFSSLSYLNQLPLDILKIDRAFIKDISHDTENGELAKLIINMAKTLGLGVIAEGIETQYQLDFLRKYQCDEFQGYLSSAPVAADLFEKFLYEKRMEPVV